MAYAYSQIDDLLQQGQQKQDIFGQGQQGAQPLAPGQEGQAGGVQKTSTEGEVGQSGSSGAAQQPAKVQSADTGAGLEAQKAALEASSNYGKPAVIGDISKNIRTQSETLQSRADKYVTDQKAAQNYRVSRPELEAAYSGKDEKAAEKVRSLLGGTQSLKEIKDFEAPDVRVSDADLVGGDAGLQRLVSRGQGARYTPGMAAFDVQALRMKPGFDADARQIQKGYSDLRNKAESLPESARAQVEQYGTEQRDLAQSEAKAYFDNLIAQMKATNEGEATEYNKFLDPFQAGQGKMGLKELASAKQAIKARLTQANPRAVQFVDSQAPDLAKYTTARGDVSSADFVNQAEADQFNRIMGLLGGSDTWAAGTAPDSAYSTDTAGLEDALLKGAIGAREGRDVDIKKEMDAVKKIAQSRADASDTLRLATDYKKDKGVLKTAGNQAAAIRAGLTPDQQKYANSANLALDPYLVQGAAQDFGWQDVLSKAEAKRLSGLSTELGENQAFSLGSTKRNPIGTFDQDAYKNALMAMINQAIERENAATGAAGAAQAAPKPIGTLAMPGDSGVVLPANPQMSSQVVANPVDTGYYGQGALPGFLGNISGANLAPSQGMPMITLPDGRQVPISEIF